MVQSKSHMSIGARFATGVQNRRSLIEHLVRDTWIVIQKSLRATGRRAYLEAIHGTPQSHDQN
jgi:hypothetical protein